MQKKQIILASASPRRKELLELMGLEFTILPSEKEEIITKSRPDEIAAELADAKANEVFEKSGGDVLVIGSDTIVVYGGEIMGKPQNEEDAFRMLHRLQGNVHEVYTAVAVYDRSADKITKDIFCRKAEVRVHSMTDEEIRQYISLGESLDKAGAYGIQGRFAVFVEEIKGEYNTVLGLPVAGLYQVLKKYL